MDIGSVFKIDHWSKFVLLCGILLSAAAFFFDIQFVSQKYVLGLGIGLVLIGVGYWMARGVAHLWADRGMYQWIVYEHTILTKIIVGIGVIVSIYFFIRIMIQLVI